MRHKPLFTFICKKFKDKYYVCLIEKKTIDFKNFNKINIISVKIRLKIKSYEGCIFDGRIVNLGGCCAYLITKPFMVYGKLIERNFKNSLECLKEFVNESYIVDPNMNSILFKISSEVIVEIHLFFPRHLCPCLEHGLSYFLEIINCEKLLVL